MDLSTTIQQLPFMDQVSAEISEQLFGMAQRVSLPADSILVKQFDLGEYLYFLIEGEVAISIPFKETASEYNVGVINEAFSPIGWSAFRHPSRYATTFSTTKDSVLVAFPVVELKKLLEAESDFGNDFLHYVFQSSLPVLDTILNQTRPFFSNESLAFEETRPFHKSHNLHQNVAQAKKILANAPFFEELEEKEIQGFAKVSKQLLVHQGDIISQQDQYADGLYLLVSGKVVVSYQTDHGEVLTTRTISRAGTVLSWCTLDEEIKNRNSIIASRDSTLLYFSREDIKTLLAANPALNIKYWYRLIWLISTYLLAARMRYLSQSSNNEVLAVRNVVEQNAARLPVTSSLYKVGELLKNPVTTDEAFGFLYKNLHYGCVLERTIAGMCLDILKDVQRENGFYRQLQKAYDVITHLPSEMPATDVRRESVALFQQAFQQVPYVIKGLENLPKQPGNLFIYNHLTNAPSTCLPNGFQFPLDAQFISSMIIDKEYGISGVRVVRRSQHGEYWRDDYYRRFGNLFVDSWDRLSKDEELHQLFLQAGHGALNANTPLLIAPEGANFSTDMSPGPIRTSAFELAATMDDEPWIVPIAVANFDKRVDHSVYAVVIKPAFKLSSRIDLKDPMALDNFTKEYQSEFRGYVEEAIQLAEDIRKTPSLSSQEGYRSNARKLNQLEAEFESDVRALEFRLSQHHSDAGPVAFYGSSTFRMWSDLCAHLGRNDAINLGFGAATLEACSYYFERIVLPQKPRSIVLYAGDNDIGNLRDANTVIAQYIELLHKIDAHLPGIAVSIVSIKPSPARMKLLNTIIKVNDALKRLALTRPNTTYVDLFSSLMDDRGELLTQYFEEDELHLNARGYKVWAKQLKQSFPFIFDSLTK